MGVEIERKFLVKGDGWRDQGKSRLIRQGFFLSIKDRAVRIRVMGDRAYLTMKSEAQGFVRKEYEYDIPVDEAMELLDTMCEKPLVEKTRNWVEHNGKTWVVDEFHGDNDGLVMAEIELDSEDEDVDRPGWAGLEVSDNPRYYNVYLAKHPFKTWHLHKKTPSGADLPHE